MIKFIRPKDVQTRLGISKQKAYDLIKLSTFPRIMIGKNYYIPEDKFDEWLLDNIRYKRKLL